MLCQKCQKREATCHICNVVDGGNSTSLDLCSECFETESPEAKEWAAESAASVCEYCGGSPCAGGTDFLAMVTGVQKSKYMCLLCSMEHNRYNREQLQKMDLALSQQEQLAALRRLDVAANEHMKRWVSERTR
jgi:protein-arginine kinase activator protein McsA